MCISKGILGRGGMGTAYSSRDMPGLDALGEGRLCIDARDTVRYWGSPRNRRGVVQREGTQADIGVGGGSRSSLRGISDIYRTGTRERAIC